MEPDSILVHIEYHFVRPDMELPDAEFNISNHTKLSDTLNFSDCNDDMNWKG